MRTMDDDHGDWLHEVARDKRLDTLAADEVAKKLEARVAELEALLREARAALDPDEDGRLCRDIEEATGWGK